MRASRRAPALIVVAAFGLAACTGGGRASVPTTTPGGGGTVAAGGALKLGFLGPLSGSSASYGTNVEDAEKLAIAQYDQTNPKNPVAIDIFDSANDATAASGAAAKLVGDGVVAVIGPGFSNDSQAADPVFEQAHIPDLSASATDVRLAQNGWKYFHRVLADDSYQAPADASYIVKTLHQTAVAVVDDGAAYGKGLADAVRQKLAGAGGTDVLDAQIDATGSDDSSTVNKVVAANAQAVFFGGYYDEAGLLVKQLRAAGFKGVFLSGDGTEDDRFVSSAGGTPGQGGSAAEGALATCACADGTNSSSSSSFAAAYRSMFNTDPATYSAEAYDATNFVLAAVKAGYITGPAINAYLAANSWAGVTKTIRFLPNGDVSGAPIYLYKVQNGRFTQIGTTS
ncbi:MAG: branched-chain amino acid ABC transporter substrate-binding protein [Acidimicrobiales bacterium]|nr:branched-chain amino acid ABC transporter substrate-binding protein [Acidimicrobiales bacterium]